MTNTSAPPLPRKSFDKCQMFFFIYTNFCFQFWLSSVSAPVAVSENVVCVPRPKYKSRLEFSFRKIFSSRNSGPYISEMKFIVAKSNKSFEGLKCFKNQLWWFYLKNMFQCLKKYFPKLKFFHAKNKNKIKSCEIINISNNSENLIIWAGLVCQVSDPIIQMVQMKVRTFLFCRKNLNSADI